MELFKNFLTDESVYIEAQNYWHEICLKVFKDFNQENLWAYWLTLKTLNGTSLRDGNPIISWINQEEKKGIIITQHSMVEGPLRARMGVFDEDVAAIKYLKIKCFLTQETSKKVQELIGSWIGGRYNEKEMNQRIEEITSKK